MVYVNFMLILDVQFETICKFANVADKYDTDVEK